MVSFKLPPSPPPLYRVPTPENTLTYHNALFFVTPKFCIRIVFGFSWKLKWPQEKLRKKFWGDKQRALWYVMLFSLEWSIEF